jgi:hypothetical protein
MAGGQRNIDCIFAAETINCITTTETERFRFLGDPALKDFKLSPPLI